MFHTSSFMFAPKVLIMSYYVVRTTRTSLVRNRRVRKLTIIDIDTLIPTTAKTNELSEECGTTEYEFSEECQN